MGIMEMSVMSGWKLTDTWLSVALGLARAVIQKVTKASLVMMY